MRYEPRQSTNILRTSSTESGSLDKGGHCSLTLHPLPLPMGEVAAVRLPERALSVSFADSSPKGGAKRASSDKAQLILPENDTELHPMVLRILTSWRTHCPRRLAAKEQLTCLLSVLDQLFPRYTEHPLTPCFRNQGAFDYAYRSQLPTVLGKGMASRMLPMPVRYMTQRSKPRPKPA